MKYDDRLRIPSTATAINDVGQIVASVRLRRRFLAVKRLDTIRASGIKQTMGFPSPDLR
jgi:hypothetical protein